MSSSAHARDGQAVQHQQPCAEGELAGDRSIPSSFFSAQARMDLDGVLACWHNDGVMRMPYAPAPLPRQHCERATLTRKYTALFQGSWAIELTELPVIATEQKQLWLALWAFNIHLRSGATYSGRDIGTFRLRDGLICEHAEYFNPFGFAQAYGMTPSPEPPRET